MSLKCPPTHTAAFNHGAGCCSHEAKVNDTGLHPECDGKVMDFYSNEACCSDPIDCPGAAYGRKCTDAPIGTD